MEREAGGTAHRRKQWLMGYPHQVLPVPRATHCNFLVIIYVRWAQSHLIAFESDRALGARHLSRATCVMPAS